MTPTEFYKQLQNYENDTSIKLPVPIKVGPSDAMAGKLILWLFEQMPEGATQGDIEAVLDSAKWWIIFWASAFEAKD